MPILSGGGGGGGLPTTGGTLTGALAITPSNPLTTPLLSAAGAGAGLPTLAFDSSGQLTVDCLASGNRGVIVAQQTGTNSASVSISAAGSVVARGDSGEIALGKTNGSIYFFD